MSRNLYILGATLLLFAAISFGMSFTTGPYQIGLPGNGSLWKMISLFLMLASLVSIFGGVMVQMFEQVERRAEQREQLNRKRRT
jgi:ABC-type transport system involved in multi-copper enzyme maturation permease subunit